MGDNDVIAAVEFIISQIETKIDKEHLTCNICKKFLNDSVYLPCDCYVCNKHISSKGKRIKCKKKKMQPGISKIKSLQGKWVC